MNFIVLIGIIECIEKKQNDSILKLKIEKSIVSSQTDDWYEIVDVAIDNETFFNELKTIKIGDVIGIKGKVGTINNSLNLICEKLQPFN